MKLSLDSLLVVEMLKWQLHDLEQMPTYFKKDLEVRQLSYTKAAICEIIDDIFKHGDEDPINVVERFVNRKRRLSISGKSNRNRWMQSVGYDAGRYVLDELLFRKTLNY